MKKQGKKILVAAVAVSTSLSTIQIPTNAQEVQEVQEVQEEKKESQDLKEENEENSMDVVSINETEKKEYSFEIVETNGETINSTEVTFTNSDNTEVGFSYSNGQYQIVGEEGATIVATINKEGFETQTVTFTLNDNLTEVTIELEKKQEDGENIEFSDDDAWSLVNLDESASSNVFFNENVVYLAPGGTAQFKCASGSSFDEVKILQEDGSYGSAITASDSATSGVVSKSFYLFSSANNQRTSCNGDDNIIPDGKIYVDVDYPEVSFSIGTINKKKNGEIFDSLTAAIGKATNYDHLQVTVNIQDELSGVKNSEYKIIKINDPENVVGEINNAIADSDGWDPVSDDQQLAIPKASEEGYFLILLKAEDNVGNAAVYVSNGAVFDKTAPVVQISGIEDGKLYTEDELDYSITVSDPSDGTSGIDHVSVQVFKDGELIKEGKENTDTFDLTAAKIYGTEEDTIQDYITASKEKEIFAKIISENASSDDVKLIVTAYDKAGNSYTAEKKFSIDAVAPTAQISYDNNDAKNKKYFNDTRKMTVEYCERNFDESLASFKISINGEEAIYTLEDIRNGAVDGVKLISKKDSEEGKEKHTDNRKITYVLAFGAETDADYDFKITPQLKDLDGTDVSKEGISYTTDVAVNNFTIDKVAPVLSISYKNAQGASFEAGTEDNPKYLAGNVNVTVSVDERNFDTSGADAALSQKDVSDNTVNAYSEDVNELLSTGKWKKNGDTYIYDLPVFEKDANYGLSVEYEDLAGNKAEIVPDGYFTVDKTAPTGNISVVSKELTGSFSDFSETLKFQFFANQPILVFQEAEDATSGVASIEYYTYAPGAEDRYTFNGLTIEQLRNIKNWTAYNDAVSVEGDSAAVIYAKITDKAGNVSYINTQGAMISDVSAPGAPKITINTQSSSYGIHSQDVAVSFSAEDTVSGNTYAGLKSVKYEILNNGVVTQSGDYDQELSDSSARIKEIEKDIQIDSQLNNSNHVVVRITAEDYAGNVSVSEETVKIDITAPQIEVVYDNNSPENGKYYSNTRTATVRVYERNFDPSLVDFKITSTGDMPEISGWSISSAAGESDEAVNTCTITYAADADYAFSMDVTDEAGNKTSYGQTDEFTVDKTAPTINVTYDNNDVKNGKYYKATRTATITVTEHNFDQTAFESKILASLEGASITAPTVSAWSSNGDTHTATISFATDGDYSFELSCKDLAGNQSNIFVQDEFTIDITAPELTFFDVEDGTAYRAEVAPGIKFSDINHDSNGVTLTFSGTRHAAKKITESYSSESNGGQIKMSDIAHEADNDDVYTLNAKIEDLAGNVTEKEVSFSVNRFGSNFSYGDATNKLLDKYYINKEEDVVIYETNVNTLVNKGITVSLNGAVSTLDEEKDYTVEAEKTEGWMKYKYIISKNVFSDEGLYEIIVNSEDEAGNLQNNKLKEAPVSFVLDKTAPSAVITGIDDGSIYDEEYRDIQIDVTDEYAIKKADVYLNGELKKTYSGDDLKTMNNSIDYRLNEDSKDQTISVVVEDKAGNKSEEIEKTVLITKSFVARATHSNLWIYICGVICVIAGGFALLFRKKAKNE